MADYTLTPTDSVSLADFDDLFALSDSESAGVVVAKADTVTLASAEVAGLVLSANLSDSVTLTDARSSTFTKARTDVVTTSDAEADTTSRETDSWGWGNTFWDDDA